MYLVSRTRETKPKRGGGVDRFGALGPPLPPQHVTVPAPRGRPPGRRKSPVPVAMSTERAR